MGTLYSNITYQNIVDPVLSDLRDQRLANLPTKVIVRYILDAEEQITKRFCIDFQQDLRLIAERTDYYFADTTTATGTGTISSSAAVFTGVGTVFLSQIKSGSKVYAGSRTILVKSVETDLQFTADAVPTSPIVAGSSFTYDGHASEISTEMRSMIANERLEGSFVRAADINNRDRHTMLKIIEGFPVTTTYDNPSSMVAGNKDFKRYVQVYPPPNDDKTVTIHGTLVVNPYLHLNDQLSDYIRLGHAWATTIKKYLEAMLLQSYLKDEKTADRRMGAFGNDAVSTDRSFGGSPSIRMTYR